MKKLAPWLISIILSLIALISFLLQTQVLINPVVFFIIAIFFIIPYRKESGFVRRLMLLISLIFIAWVLTYLGFALLPFGIAFFLAYLFDPFVTLLEKKHFPRWAGALLVLLFFIGIVSVVAVFVFPYIFSQLDTAIKQLSNLFTTVNSYMDKKNVNKYLTSIGLKDQTIRGLVHTELVPKLKSFLSEILTSMMSLMTNISGVATQIVNAILIPILFFYILKDFNKLRNLLRTILAKKNEKLLHDLRRINKLFRIYTTWQVISASIVATVCTIVFTLFNIPYPFVLGLICGFLNPIPYLGNIASLVICGLAVLVAAPENPLTAVIVVFITINALHFINAYFLEPNIAGKQVGLHPVVLLCSLFIFSGIFGFIGLIVAVPITAALMMFFNDWRYKIVQEFKK